MLIARLAAEAELRLLERQDAEALWALTDASREHLRRWLPWLDTVRTPQDSESFIVRGLGQFAQGLGFQAGIWRQDALCGVCGLHEINWPNRQSSIGYWIGAQFEGQGLVTLACRAVLDEAFARYGLHRMELRAATGNVRSQAVASRLGFVREGVVRDAEWLYEHYVDHIVFGLLASEWHGAQESGR
jgi:ribosomal-protein-serine acetyltransferase